ncbi:sigma-70 family RNA polymerase sigma factor [Aquincola sp. S2]|uniref:Sigma-70 family RNA polymerase sigma factor n=2 Tax=Pseudaquabacterium terrae TaxID=2732868 RepID=A0ABX2EKT1_9BURK|nr:sigma-70 family RNA polymerase sigma factor [Aquabacterium terrae]NRF69218.1 sigma-70 family RNA polymerase sigma factor [Aquabacterium terrae]
MADCPPMIEPQRTDADEDARLMAAFARGDARAFDRLYERHQAALYRFVRRLLGRALAAQADEVFQDTWLRVVQARDRFVARPQDADGARAASFRTWLFTLAQNRAIDQLRRSGREVSNTAFESDDGDASFVPEGEPWLDWPAPGAAPAEDQLFWRRAGERLLGCLDQLPPPQRVVFLMHHDEDCTLDDIARALELGFETAKSRLRYAMSKLRTCMGAYLAPDNLRGAR